ncbi:unnamed protein product [Mytilus edulis]|uniref:Endonuclease/exonuclease/phosphatase domain-containing protein n=1 Tax=Mytilus edulis TaxID=6550 RepID=A0A8S3V0V4_MYTED|nr:unnamed protein product [Mytilus edulis]
MNSIIQESSSSFLADKLVNNSIQSDKISTHDSPIIQMQNRGDNVALSTISNLATDDATATTTPSQNFLSCPSCSRNIVDYDFIICVVCDEKFHFQCQNITSHFFKPMSFETLERFQCMQCNASLKDLSICELESIYQITERSANSLKSPDTIVKTVPNNNEPVKLSLEIGTSDNISRSNPQDHLHLNMHSIKQPTNARAPENITPSSQTHIDQSDTTNKHTKQSVPKKQKNTSSDRIPLQDEWKWGIYRQSDRIPEASRQAQRPNINQQVQQAQMFNPQPSELATQIPISDSNNCIAVDQTSSQQFLVNQSYRNQGNGESNMKFKVTEDVSNTLSNDSKNSFAVREDLKIKVHEDKYNTLNRDSENSFAVRIENVMEKVPNSSIQDRHSTVSNLPHDSHQNIKFISSATTNSKNCFAVKHMKETKNLDNYPKAVQPHPNHPVHSKLKNGTSFLDKGQIILIDPDIAPPVNRMIGTDSGHDAYRTALDTLKEIILKYQETHSIIIAGDFNASFIRHYKDSQDELFKQFCKENGMELPVKYPTDHTYFQGTSRSQIDYILVKFIENNMRLKDLIQVKILCEGHNTSDHSPVSADLCIELSASQKQYRENIRTKINIEKENKDNNALKVQEVLKDRKYLIIRTPYGIDQATNQLLTGLNNALDTCYSR